MSLFVNGVDQGGDHTGTTVTADNIQFPSSQSASADANNLDDYEEGTWTPTIQDDTLSDSESQTYTTQAGTYVKIGRKVYIEFNLVISSLGTLTGAQQARISGLPFSARSGSPEGPVFFNNCENLAIVANQSISGFVVASAARIHAVLWSASAGVSALTLTEVSADGALRGGGFYDVS